MTFRRNVLLSYASQAFVTGVGLVMVPFYLRYLGAEAYGLVGFFTMLQAWFQLLDMGLSPTLSREVARFRAGAVSAGQLRLLLRAMQYFFVGIASLAVLAAIGASSHISTQWLQPKSLSPAVVEEAIILMAMAVPLRWASGLYRGAVNGFEKQALLAVFNIATAFARFVGVVAAMHMISATPRVFFAYQLIVSALELAGLWVVVHRLMPATQKDVARVRFPEIVGALRFSLGVSITGVIWIVLTQADKLLLSRLLELSEFGYLSLAVAVAGGVTVVSAPLAQNLMPRLAKLHAEGNGPALSSLYRKSTQGIAGVVGFIGGGLAFMAEPILFAWTGDAVAAEKAAPMLFWYAVGNLAISLSAFPYYLQYAFGRLSFHIIGNVLLVFLMIPSIFVGAGGYGAVGASFAWFANVLLYLVLWVSFSHYKLKVVSWLKWLLLDVGLIVIPILVFYYSVGSIKHDAFGTRLNLMGMIFVRFLVGGAMAFALVSMVRRFDVFCGKLAK